MGTSVRETKGGVQGMYEMPGVKDTVQAISECWGQPLYAMCKIGSRVPVSN